MKTRNGFVSNSSSSSFVVAFPSKPNDGADVWKYMFNGKDGGLSIDYHDGLSYAQVSSIVFQSLEKENFKPATKKDIVDNFSSRYHYCTSNTFWLGKITDENGGAWYYNLNKYFGSDKKIMDQIAQLIIKHEAKDKELRRNQHELITNKIGNQPKYAEKNSIDYQTKKPFSDKEIKTYDVWCKKLEEFRKTNDDYIKLEQELEKEYREHYEQRKKLEQKIAKKDAQNFLDDNKGKFIFIISFSDNDGDQGATMEHGDIFRNVPHIRISNH